MKINCLFLAALILAVAGVCVAQPKTAASGPEKVVRDLYTAQKNESTAPFFQNKNRAAVNKYFTKDLADLIWKAAMASKGEVAALDFDPLYYSQDPQITDLVIGKPKDPAGVSTGFAVIPVAFKNNGKAEKVEFEVTRVGSIWKINNIAYSDGEQLSPLLEYALDPEFQKEFEKDRVKGDYLIGNRKCRISATKGGYAYKFDCADQEDISVYYVEKEDNDDETVFRDLEANEIGRFLFKDNKFVSGKFHDASGKEVKVTRSN